MARVLALGLEPGDHDFSNPALPPGIDAASVHQLIRSGMADLAAIGHQAEHLFISGDPGRLGPLAERLSRGGLDCVTIGGSVRLLPRHLVLFETVLNMVARARPAPRIALVTVPGDWAAAIHRVMGRG